MAHQTIDGKTQRRIQRHKKAWDARQNDAPEWRIVAGDVGDDADARRCRHIPPRANIINLFLGVIYATSGVFPYDFD